LLIENPRGGFAFLRGIAPYSAGAVALPGFAVEHASFARVLPLRDGFAAIDAHLKALGRPRQALCGIELRSPRPFTFQGFRDFNAGYVDILKDWRILLDGNVNPVARTNVAPEVNPPAEPGMFGFSFTVPARTAVKTFVVAGAGELPEGSLEPKDVVRRGETSPDALAEKIRFVMGLMSGRLQGLGVGWQDVTMVEVYTVHNFFGALAQDILKPMGLASRRGFVWHFTRPPIVSIEYEMDVRGCLHEWVL
jgi:hypothetical protein